MARAIQGMTLVEILVSLGIGMMLVALGTSALLHVSKVFTRNTAHVQGHVDAANIAQRLHSTLESLYHPALIRIHADAGPDLVWGSGEERLELSWMSSVRALDEQSLAYAPQLMNDIIWQRLVWQGDGHGGGSISFSNSRSYRSVTGWTYQLGGTNFTPNIRIGPFVRRDRRRDLDDNDLRYLPGITTANYTAVAAQGDGAELDAALLPWHPPTTKVADCVIELMDADGYVIRCDPRMGVTIRSPTGTPVPALGTAYSNATTQVLDGTWMDGRPQVPAEVPGHAHAYHQRSSSAQRPALIRVHFLLVMTTQGDRVRFEHDPRLPFAVSIAPGLTLPTL